MTFILRQITKRATGQEIIRDRTLDKTRFTIGRATSNDLFLSDLRVGLEHIEVSLNGSRVHLEALGEKKFLLNGRTVGTATFGDGPNEVLVGPYNLRFAVNKDKIWVIEITRVEPEERLSEEQVEEIFSLNGTSLSKRSPAWFGLIIAAMFFLALPMAWFFGALPNQANEVFDVDSTWLSGPLSSGHANLEGECEACHQKAFEHVTDGTCVECHDDMIDHAEPVRLATAQGTPDGFDGFLTKAAMTFGKEPGECADCHREHNGDEGVILATSTLCTDCHVDMSDRLADTTLADAGDFGTQHGNFKAVVVADPGPPATFQRLSLDDASLADNSGLKFPHDLHLDAQGGVANQAQTLGVENGFGAKLECENCHTPETGGMLFETVSMEANCQMCHSLVFEATGTVERKLPHGEPQEVIAILNEYYRARALGLAIEPTMTERRRPGGTSSLRTQDRRQDAMIDARRNADAMVARVFSEGGTCYDCHEVIPAPAGTVDYDILPVTLVDQFLTKSRFDHAQHDTGDFTCQSCHEAEGSGLASQVLLPGIETRVSDLTGEDVVGCRDCHGGEKASADLIASSCVDCHGYHDGTHAPVMTADFDPGRWGHVPSGASLR